MTLAKCNNIDITRALISASQLADCLLFCLPSNLNQTIEMNVQANSKSPGKATERSEKAKMVLYEDLCKDFIFTPIAVETFGSWGQDGLSLIKEIGRKICNTTGEKRSSFYLFQRISIAIQRGNAASVIGTAGSSSKLDEIFYL